MFLDWFCPNMMDITAICHFNRTVASMISGIRKDTVCCVWNDPQIWRSFHTSVGHYLCHLGPSLKILSICFCVLQQHHDLFSIDSSHSMTIEPPAEFNRHIAPAPVRQSDLPPVDMAGTLLSDIKKNWWFIMVNNGILGYWDSGWYSWLLIIQSFMMSHDC